MPEKQKIRTRRKMKDCLPPALKGFVGVDYDQELAEDVVNNTTYEGEPSLSRKEITVFRHAMLALNKAQIPYAVGSAFARNYYTGIWRNTKDLDIFLKPEDLKTAMESLSAAGFDPHIEFEHWLAQAYKDSYQVDLIFGTGHGQIPVDDTWFEHSLSGEVLGVPTHLIAPEEMITSALFVAERRRFDGSEIVHLIHALKGKLDWERILNRLGEHRELLLWHLILFDYIYPGHSNYLPQQIMLDLFEEARQRWSARKRKTKSFRGILLDPFAFTVDITDRGYEDRRNLDPLVNEEGETL